MGIKINKEVKERSTSGYKYFRHTADAKFQAYGITIEEAFTNAALATASLMWDPEKIRPKEFHNVKVSGLDLKQLLVEFLEEILYLLDTCVFLLHAVEELQIYHKKDRYDLKAIFRGDRYSHEYVTFGDVKAVTYSDMKIEKKDHFILQVVVDM
jgi:SHS2 domain-containing protein